MKTVVTDKIYHYLLKPKIMDAIMTLINSIPFYILFTFAIYSNITEQIVTAAYTIKQNTLNQLHAVANV
jgi:hypothetical protein